MISKAIETAIKMETDAMSFYQEAASKTSHPFGKKMFEGFVKDETRHLKMLQDVFAGLKLDSTLVLPREAVKTVFSELKEQMITRVKASSDELAAITLALDFERAGYEFYKKSAADATNEKEKDLFRRLAEEEQDHYTILQNTDSFMKDTGDWFMWEEQGTIIEG